MGRTRSSFGRLIGAHKELLQAELGQALREAGVIAALAGAALALALLALILLYVGTFLFLGEWLFGSMGWGILHGFLLTVCFIVPIGLNLGGGNWRNWLRAFILALVIGIVVGVILATNALHNAAVWLARQLQGAQDVQQGAQAVQLGLRLWLVPAVVVGLLLGLVGLVIGLRRGGGALPGVALGVAGFILGFVVAGFLAAVPLSTQVAAALAVTLWLILWLALSAVFALEGGLDPKSRYDKLVPRESIAQFSATRAYLEQQWQRQRKKLVGR